jgi:hypothetical protein
LQISDKNVIELQQTVSVFSLYCGPNDGASDNSASTLNDQNPKPGEGRGQRQKQKTEVHHDA